MTSQTVRLTVAQAVVTYLSRQHSVADGQRRRLIPATLASSATATWPGSARPWTKLSGRHAIHSGPPTSRPWYTAATRSPSTAGGTPPWP